MLIEKENDPTPDPKRDILLIYVMCLLAENNDSSKLKFLSSYDFNDSVNGLSKEQLDFIGKKLRAVVIQRAHVKYRTSFFEVEIPSDLRCIEIRVFNESHHSAFRKLKRFLSLYQFLFTGTFTSENTRIVIQYV